MGPGQSTYQLVSQDFQSSTAVAPRIYAGYALDDGLGVRLTWWQFDEQSAQQNPTNGPSSPGTTVVIGAPSPFSSPGVFSNSSLLSGSQQDVFNLYSVLKLNVWDFDLQQTFSMGRWGFLLGGGVRYAHISQGYRGTLNHLGTGLPNDIESVQIDNNFTGTGPTAFLEGRCRFNLGFSLYGNLRGGLLYGQGRQNGFALNQGSTPGSLVSTADLGSGAETVSFAQMEGGLEYRASFSWGEPFLRLGVQAQNWWDIGNASTLSGNPRSSLGLLGGVFSAGMNF